MRPLLHHASCILVLKEVVDTVMIHISLIVWLIGLHLINFRRLAGCGVLCLLLDYDAQRVWDNAAELETVMVS